MGRKNKHSADFFPHYVVHGSKMQYMESKYNNDGYAVWFKVMEKLGASDHHFCDLSKKLELKFMANRCNVDENTFIEIMNLLAEFEWLDAELWTQKRVIYSQEFVNSLDRLYKRRNELKPTLKFINDYINAINVDINAINVDIKTQSKVKESKVKTTTAEISSEKVPLKQFLEMAYKDVQWRNYFISEYNIYNGYWGKALKDFQGTQGMRKMDDALKTYDEWCRHFTSWMYGVKKRKELSEYRQPT